MQSTSLTNKIKSVINYIVKEDKNTTYVDVNTTHFKVVNHWFWNRFKKETWEPETYNIMRKYLRKDKSCIDIGTWVGPTIMYAAEIGAEKIYGIEANPLTYKMLDNNRQMNALVENKLSLYNLCISDKDGELVDFGGKRGADTSSASSIRGNQWKIPSTTICSWIEKYEVSNFNFLKIDIEGAEKFIEKDLVRLANTQDLAILFSLHPPFWEDKNEVAQIILNICDKYDVFDIKEKALSLEELKERMLTSESKPAWGTKYGNFFEILLKTKNQA